MKINGMKYILLAVVAVPLAFGAFAEQGKVEKPAPAPEQAGSVVAQKLKTCKFLLNGTYKKNAKVYICLCSASWCGPCCREMPRIAKIYAEKLQANPNIELIHFSYDDNDERALAWAKENNVKFPVVKPNGGNPLNLSTNGVPHMFFVGADGKIIKQGHPSYVFTEKALDELK